MSQRQVERVIGRLVTDEDFRREFRRDPATALRSMCGCGSELTEVEARALAALDPDHAAAFAGTLDARLQKLCVGGTEEA